MLRVNKVQVDNTTLASELSQSNEQYMNCVFEQQKPQKKPKPQKTDSKQATKSDNPPIELKDVKSLKDVAIYTGLNREYIDSLANHEDLKLETYSTERKIKDKTTGEVKTVKVLTIGYGHKVLPKDNIKEGDTITPEKACKILAQDLDTKIGELEALIDDTGKLTIGQKIALTDLIYQNGSGTLKGSFIINTINEAKNDPKKLDKAVAGFESYINYLGKPSPDMCKRRLQNICDYSSQKPTKIAFETMNNIRDKGATYFDNKIQMTNQADKGTIKNLLHQKESYLKEADEIIEKLKQPVKESTHTSTSKTPEKGFWKATKDIFIWGITHPVIEP